MAYGGKYQSLVRDRLNVLWKNIIKQKDYQAPAEIITGFRYNWWAMRSSIAASGWRVPTEDDWNTLFTFLGGTSSAGGYMKETGLTYWDSPNTGATNSSKYNGRGGGIRLNNGTFLGWKSLEFFWINKDFGLNELYCYSLLYNSAAVGTANSDSSDVNVTRRQGLPIRLVKETTTLTHGQTSYYTGNDGKVYLTICIGTQEWLASNLAETKFSGGADITEVTDNSTWSSLLTAAFCAYDNNWDNAYLEGGEGNLIFLYGAGETPLKIEYLNKSDDIFDPIKSSRAKINVYCFSMFALSEIYSVDRKEFMLEVYQGENLFWQGFIDPSLYQEKYGPAPYDMEITAIDGLTLLRNIRYEESEGIPYNGWKLVSQIILDILGKIGVTSFAEMVNVYEDRMDEGVTDSPFDQLKINTDVFQDKYCEEVLEEILGIFNANIRLIDGVFFIFRPLDCRRETVYGRLFTDATTKTGFSVSQKQYIKRPDYVSDYLQVPDSIASAIAPAKKIIIKQDYGYRESWIDSYNFLASDYDEDNESFEGWDFYLEDYKDVHHISEFLPNEKEGVALSTTNFLQAVCLTQNIGDITESENDVFTLEFEFGWFNNTGASNNSVTNIFIQIVCENYFLKEKDDTYLEWTTTPSSISILPVDILGSSTVPAGFTSWYKYTRIVEGVPASGTLQIYVGCQLISNIYNCYKYIKFFVSSFATYKNLTTALRPVGFVRPDRPSTLVKPKKNFEEISKIERIYIETNDLEGEEITYEYLLGDVADTQIDNVIGQFKGALALYTEGPLLPTQTWHTRGNSENLPLLQLICQERKTFYSQFRQFVDMTIMEVTKAETALKLIGNFQDVLNISSGYLRALFINRGTFDVRYRQWKLDLVEVGQGEAAGGELPESITVDSTEITVDSTTITVDHT